MCNFYSCSDGLLFTVWCLILVSAPHKSQEDGFGNVLSFKRTPRSFKCNKSRETKSEWLRESGRDSILFFKSSQAKSVEHVCLHKARSHSSLHELGISWFTLNMQGCSKLRKFPDMSTNIRKLDISKTAVEDVPASIAMWFSRGLHIFPWMYCGWT